MSADDVQRLLDAGIDLRKVYKGAAAIDHVLEDEAATAGSADQSARGSNILGQLDENDLELISRAEIAKAERPGRCDGPLGRR